MQGIFSEFLAIYLAKLRNLKVTFLQFEGKVCVHTNADEMLIKTIIFK